MMLLLPRPLRSAAWPKSGGRNVGTLPGWSVMMIMTITLQEVMVVGESSKIAYTGGRGVIDGTFGRTSSIAAVDWDGDGDVDFLMNDINEDVALYINKDSGVFEKTVLYEEIDDPEAIVAGDLNGDGLPDIVTCSDTFFRRANGPVLIHFQNATTGLVDTVSTVIQREFLGSSSVDCSAAIIADLDGDGDLDIAVTLQLRDAPGDWGLGRFVVLWNDGQGNFGDSEDDVEVLPEAHGGAQHSKMVAADFNGDGFMDLVMADNNQGLLVAYYNSGQGSFPERTVLDATAEATYDIAMGDLDNDDDPDLALVDNGLVVVYQNRIDSFVKTTLFDDQAFGNRFRVAGIFDIDGNGFVDVVYTSTNKGFVTYIPQETRAAFGAQEFSVAVESAGHFVFADVNGDGIDDLVVGAGNERKTYYFLAEEMTPTASTAAPSAAPGSSSNDGGGAPENTSGCSPKDLMNRLLAIAATALIVWRNI